MLMSQAGLARSNSISNNSLRPLLELDIILPTWPLTIYKMTINKEVRLIVHKLIPDSSHKNLGFDITPLQNARTVPKTNGLNGIQHLRLQPSSLLF